MSGEVVPVQLTRDGQNTAWGFRLLGGADVGLPLTIQRVCLGSPSEGELRRGDVLLRVGDRDVSRLTHQEAHDLIRSAGNHLSLLLHRVPGAPGFQTPLSPGSNGISAGHHPLEAAGGNFNYSSGNMFQQLPTTNFDRRLPYTPDPQAMDDYERLESRDERRREKQSIVHQAYRTTPLIAPQAKRRHDLPTGSYLRHVQDPNWQKPTHPGATPIFNYNARVKLDEAAPPSSILLGGSKDDSVPVFHRQYNSPINMYSTQNLLETMAGQTGLQPSSGVGSSNPRGLKGGLLQTPSTRKHVYKDISLSPTYQMIHDREWKDLEKSKLKEHVPVEDKVYSAPFGADDNYTVNAFGVPRGRILQSGSFNTLRTSLTLGHTDIGHSDF